MPSRMGGQLTTLHYWNFNLLLLLAAVHILAVLYHFQIMKENLIGAMFTGVKHVPPALLRERRTGPRATPPRRVASRESPQSAEFPSGWRAAALMAVAVAIVLAIVRAAGWAGYQ